MVTQVDGKKQLHPKCHQLFLADTASGENMALDKIREHFNKEGTSAISLLKKNRFREQHNSISQPQSWKEQFFPADMNPEGRGCTANSGRAATAPF